MQTKQNQLQMSRNQGKYIIKFKPEQDAVYWIHLSTAQDAGLEFWQTGSDAIITCQSVPKECVVKVVSESGKRELFARQLTPRKGSKVTLRTSWVHARSNNLREPRETESRLQTWNSNPIPSGSRNRPKEKFEQSVDLRVDGTPNDETYQDEQYMQRIAEQVQKLVNTERSLEADSPKDYSKWEGREENSWSRQLRLAWSSAKNKESTMSTLLFIHRSWIPSMSHAEESGMCQKKCFPAQDKNLSNSSQTPSWHSKGRAEPDMVLSPCRRIISMPKSLWERSTKKKPSRRFLTASRMMEYFMQASYNIIGQKNGANIWYTLEQWILRTMLLWSN